MYFSLEHVCYVSFNQGKIPGYMSFFRKIKRIFMPGFFCLFVWGIFPTNKKKKEKKIGKHISVSVEMGFNLLPPNDHL